MVIIFSEAESEVAPNKKTVMNVCSVFLVFIFYLFFLMKLFKTTTRQKTEPFSNLTCSSYPNCSIYFLLITRILFILEREYLRFTRNQV